MTKTSRRILFLLVATVANFVLTLIIAIALYVGVFAISNWLNLKLENGAIILLPALIVSVVISGFIYSRVLKAFRKRPDLEERFGLLK